MRFENFERSTQIIGGALRVPRILDKQINQLLKAQTCRSPPVYILYGNSLISGFQPNYVKYSNPTYHKT